MNDANRHDVNYDMISINDKKDGNSFRITSVTQFCTFFIPNLRYSIHNKKDKISGHELVRELLMKHTRHYTKYNHHIVHFCGNLATLSLTSSLLTNISSNWIKMLRRPLDETSLLLHELDNALILSDKKPIHNPPLILYIFDFETKQDINIVAKSIQDHYSKMKNLKQYLLVMGSVSNTCNDLFSQFINDPVTAYLTHVLDLKDISHIDGYIFIHKSSKHLLYEIIVQRILVTLRKNGITFGEYEWSELVEKLFAAMALYGRYCIGSTTHTYFSIPSLKSCIEDEYTWDDLEEKVKQFSDKCKNDRVQIAINWKSSL